VQHEDHRTPVAVSDDLQALNVDSLRSNHSADPIAHGCSILPGRLARGFRRARTLVCRDRQVYCFGGAAERRTRVRNRPEADGLEGLLSRASVVMAGLALTSPNARLDSELVSRVAAASLKITRANESKARVPA
jgi:hypothetical protein